MNQSPSSSTSFRDWALTLEDARDAIEKLGIVKATRGYGMDRHRFARLIKAMEHDLETNGTKQ